MLNRIFPKALDNRYRGHWLGLWLFVPIVLLHTAIDLVGIFKSDGGAQSADGIPLDTFPPVAAEAVVGVVAFLGFAGLMMGLMYLVALFRYRAMIPLMYLLIVVDYLGHKGVGLMKPIVRVAGANGGYITLALFTASVIGLALAVSGKGYQSKPETGAA
jgi:hypothetical protein